MDLGLLGSYGGDSSASEAERDGNGASDTTSSDYSSEQSLDSVAARAAAAEARLRDYGDEGTSGGGSALPSANAAFSEVDGPPVFLNPEATRPLAMSAMHGPAAAAAAATAAAAAVAAAAQGGGRRPGKAAAGAGWDIASMAPPQKGQQQQDPSKRGPPGAVIECKAKRYKGEEGPEATQSYTAAQIAMLGGNAPAAGAAGDDSRPARGPASAAMPVSEFLDKGVGGALLPRSKQDRKEKEKKKRGLGQSSIGVWKTEAEMVLRQQYDT